MSRMVGAGAHVSTMAVNRRRQADIGGPYTGGAVVFDGATELMTAGLVSVDGSKVAFSYWVYFFDFTTNPALWASDPANVEPSNNNVGTDATIVICLGTEDGGTLFQGLVQASSIPPLTWLHFLFAGDMDQDAGAKIGKLKINGVDTAYTLVFDTHPAFVPTFNGLSFYIGNDTFGDYLKGYLFDYWFATNQSLLTDGDISPATEAKFSSGGKPVDLGADGSAPTGVAPTIFLHIPHGGDPADFADNRGTGGALTVNGALTLAPSSPSD